MAQLGEEILHLARLCRRLETPEDRNLPFLPPVPPMEIFKFSQPDPVQEEVTTANVAIQVFIESIS